MARRWKIDEEGGSHIYTQKTRDRVGKVAVRDRSPAVSGFLDQSEFEVGDKSHGMVPLVSGVAAPHATE